MRKYNPELAELQIILGVSGSKFSATQYPNYSLALLPLVQRDGLRTIQLTPQLRQCNVCSLQGMHQAAQGRLTARSSSFCELRA